MKKAIVTGANGFIGSMLTRKLTENGFEVLAVDKSFENKRLPDDPNIKCVESDLSDTDSFISHIGFDEYSLFYHLAWRGINGPQKCDPHIQLCNIDLALRCAELAKKIGCEKFLCAGTIAERSTESLNHLQKTGGSMMYGSAKKCAHIMLETYCKNIGQQFVWMQFSNIYGPGNKTGNLVSYTLNEIMNSKTAAFGPAAQAYDFIYADDLLEAVYRLGVMKTKENFYFIGSGKPRILREYLMRIGELCNAADRIGIGIRDDDGIRYDFNMFDSGQLSQEIGEYALTDFDEGIRQCINEYKQLL